MKEIQLSQGKAVLVDDEDFDYLSQWKWAYTKKVNKYAFDNEYAYRLKQIKNKITHIYMHRIIMNTEKGIQVDHIDRNGLNNQKSNLRNCTHSENMSNRARYSQK